MANPAEPISGQIYCPSPGSFTGHQRAHQLAAHGQKLMAIDNFSDVLVNDRSLRELIVVPEELAPLEFGATSLRDDLSPRVAIEQLDQLLGRKSGDFSDGRVALYLCPIDGDLWCGAVSVEIERTPESVTWQKLGWQKPEPLDGPDIDLFHNDSFTFDRRQYEDVFEALRSRYVERASPSAVVRDFVRRCLRRLKLI